jgi:hypothetical protein
VSSRTQSLKAPFPYFGGKSKVAQLVWDRLGPVDNYVEPFAGSLAVLLLRPDPPKIETVNDLDCYVANVWRATQHDPEGVAAHADGPVNEADLHARHRWLVLSDDAAKFRERMRTEPDYFDAKIAGWWCWGLCCWIGSGWCSTPESEAMPYLQGGLSKGCYGMGVNKVNGETKTRGQDARKPRIDGGEGQYGHGVHAKGQLPAICGGDHHYGMGVHAKGPRDSNRPQLADAFSRGRGVNGNDSAGTCEQRRAWLLGWFGRLRDRLRTVRVCCGHWLRVCDSESVTTRLGTTGIFFDPPYGVAAGRDMKLYAQDSGTVAADVRAYCLERGGDPAMRIVLAGYAGEGHEALEDAGWEVVAWKAAGGYGNRSAKGKANAAKERLWFSPHCLRRCGLFDVIDSEAP